MTRVLLAEDDVAIAEPLARALRREGYDVDLRADGPGALALAQSGVVDLLVLDIGLPGTEVFASDKVADTIDYEQVALRIKALAGEKHYRLVETLADCIATMLTADFGAPSGPNPRRST